MPRVTRNRARPTAGVNQGPLNRPQPGNRPQTANQQQQAQPGSQINQERVPAQDQHTSNEIQMTVPELVRDDDNETVYSDDESESMDEIDDIAYANASRCPHREISQDLLIENRYLHKVIAALRLEYSALKFSIAEFCGPDMFNNIMVYSMDVEAGDMD